MKNLLFLAALCGASAFAQARFSASTGDVSLTAAGTTLTIQQSATAGVAKNVKLESALISCSVACNVTQAQNGTAATATAGTAVGLLPTFATATASVFTASNVGAGTAIGGTVKLTSAGSVVLDLSKISLPTGGSATNYSISISSITGTANITLIWSEQ